MITPSDAGQILTAVAAYDQRTVGVVEAQAWSAALNRAEPAISLEDALNAVVDWFSETIDDRRIRPAHVIQGAHRIAYRRAGAKRSAQLAAQQALPAAPEPELTPGRRAELLAKIPTGTPNVLRRREWIEWERAEARRRDREAGSEPNPLFTGFPPPGGFPISGEAA
jgi:hypothetical protein